jgi:hypothetical protein
MVNKGSIVYFVHNREKRKGRKMKTEKRQVMMRIMGSFITIMILITTVEALSVNAKEDKITKDIENHSAARYVFELYLGIISNVSYEGGWTPTVHFHVISAHVLCNQRPCVTRLRNTEWSLPTGQYVGLIKAPIICVLFAY